MNSGEDLRDFLIDNWFVIENDISKVMNHHNKYLRMQGEKFNLADIVERETLVDEISNSLKTGILNVVETYDESSPGCEWQKLTIREADEEERADGYKFMYVGRNIPDIGEWCLVSDGTHIWLEEWVEFDVGVGFEETDPPIWWMPLPELPKKENIKKQLKGKEV